MSINVEHLVKSYGPIKAVDDISFQISQGEVFGMLGPNGAGKTTTVEIIERLRQADSGRVTVLGLDVTKATNKIKQRIGIQVQSPALLPLLKVEEILDTFAGLYHHSLPVNDLLELLALQESRKILVKNLSGGQQQRLSVAMALVNDPEIAFLDVYERQVEWYLTTFIIPDDYQQRILEAHRKVTAAYDETEDKRRGLEASLARLKDQHRWGHIGQEEYLKEYRETELQLRQLSPVTSSEDNLKRLADFLANVAEAWREANQEQRNKLARVLFEQIWIEDSRVIEVKPRDELKTFFQLSFEEHLEKSIWRPRKVDGSRHI